MNTRNYCLACGALQALLVTIILHSVMFSLNFDLTVTTISLLSTFAGTYALSFGICYATACFFALRHRAILP